MCRFVAYLGEALPAAPLVFGGEHSLYRQSWDPRELLSGSVNADGYGVVWYREGRPRRIAEARPIWHDDDLEGALGGLSSTCILAALRNATPGQPVDRAGLLPLVHDRFAFILNGFVPDFHAAHMRALRAELPDDLYASLRGASDAETLFLSAVGHVRKGAGLSEALEEVARSVQQRVGKTEAQLNMVLADGERIGVLRASTVLLTNSLYTSGSVSFAPDGVVLSAEALDPGAVWTPVDGHHRVEIDEAGLSEAERVFL
jgi:glutamine amidotransferase